MVHLRPCHTGQPMFPPVIPDAPRTGGRVGALRSSQCFCWAVSDPLRGKDDFEPQTRLIVADLDARAVKNRYGLDEA